ncbi:MAG: DUF4386 family protein [Chloroflexi bacterium]|nr:DUF4386 family protein [Chloroflexota bacterium]
MNLISIRRAGGWFAIMAAVAYVLWILMGGLLFASAPSGAQLGEAEGVLSFLGGLSEGQRALGQSMTAFQLVANVLTVLVLAALYLVLRNDGPVRALSASAAAALSVPVNIFSALLSFPLYGPLSDGFASATAAERATSVSLYTFSVSLLEAAEVTSSLILGAALIAYGLAMARSAVPRWVAWLTLAAGIGMLAGGLLQATVAGQFGILPSIARLLWLAALGIGLLRKMPARAG